MFALAAFSLTSLYLLLTEKNKRQQQFILAVSVLTIGSVLSGLFLISIFRELLLVKNLTGFAAIYKAESMAIYSTHWTPENLLSLRRIAIFAVFLIILQKLSLLKNKGIVFLSLALFAAEICFNSNIIIGKAIQLDHFYYVISSCICVFLAGQLFYYFLIKSKFEMVISKFLLFVVITISILGAVKNTNIAKST